MTIVAFAKINDTYGVNLLSAYVESAFQGEENRRYLDEIYARKNQNSVKESLSALALLRRLSVRCGADNSSLILKKSEGGKPYFQNSALRFSISHSHGYVAAAISDSCEVGLDVEASDMSPEQAKKLASRFFNNDELAKLDSSPESFLRIWTKKEAYAKMRGIALSKLISNEKNGIENERETTFFYCFDVDGYSLTLCSEIYDGDVRLLEESIEEMIKCH